MAEKGAAAGGAVVGGAMVVGGIVAATGNSDQSQADAATKEPPPAPKTSFCMSLWSMGVSLPSLVGT